MHFLNTMVFSHSYFFRCILSAWCEGKQADREETATWWH